MIQIPAQRIRLALDVSKWLPGTIPTDVISGNAVQIANGADLIFELMFSYGAMTDGPPSTVLDLSDFASVIIALQNSSNPHNATTYWSVTVPVANFNNTVTAAQWGASQPNSIAQVTALVTGAANALVLSGSPGFWLCVYAVSDYPILAGVSISGGGTGYQANDVLTIAGGTLIAGATAATVQVTSVNAGVITGLQILTYGGWSVNPSTPNAATGGHGMTASIGLTFTAAQRQIPLQFFNVNIMDTGMPVLNPISSPQVLGYDSFLCSDGYYRRQSVVMDGAGNWVPVVDQTARTSP